MDEQLTKRLKGAYVLVTGAGRGLGAALALHLADFSCNLILCGRSHEKLETVAQHIKTRTRQYPKTIALDLADASSIEAAVQEINQLTPSLDILINNGAMWLGHRHTPYSAAEVQAVIASAISGTFLLTQALLPSLKESKRPDVVTIGSITALENASLHNVSVPFYAAKHGQAAIADGLRQMFWGTNIRSICIHPPWLKDISPLDPEWNNEMPRSKGESATNRDIVEAVIYAITRPRHITIASMVIDSDSQGTDFRSHISK